MHHGTDRSNDTKTSTPSPTVSLATVLEAFTAAIHNVGIRNLGALKLDVETVTWREKIQITRCLTNQMEKREDVNVLFGWKR